MIVKDGVEYITAREYAAETGQGAATILAARRAGLGGLGEAAIVVDGRLYFPRPAIAAWRAAIAPRYRARLPVLGPGGDALGVYAAADLAIEYQRPGLRGDEDYDNRWALVGPDGLLSAWSSPEAALLAADDHTRERPVRMTRAGADRFVLSSPSDR